MNKLRQLINDLKVGNDINEHLVKKADQELYKLELSTSHNSNYAVTAGDQPTPKVCPNCGEDEDMYFSKDGRWHCNNCQVHGVGQTFA